MYVLDFLSYADRDIEVCPQSLLEDFLVASGVFRSSSFLSH